jgi:hypothetical protein
LSSVNIAGDTSGLITLQAPAVSGSTVLTLPAVSGTLISSGGAASFTDLTTTGNTILGNASTDTLNVGNGDLIKDASGNVGIGTASPAVKFQIGATGAGGFSFDTTTATLAGTYGTGGGIVLRAQVTGSTGGGQIFLGGSARGDAQIDSITFYTNNTERMRIPPTGGIQSVNCVSVGNATPSTSGAGITFPATQSASTDANTLDDYEEGTWTPVISNAGTDVGATYLYRSGRYVKIGNTVWVSFGFRLSGVGSGGSLNIYINGLPFAANTYGAYQEPATAGAAGNLNNAANAVMVRYYPAGSGSTLIFTRLANGGDTQWLYNDLTSTSFLSAQLSYTV